MECSIIHVLDSLLLELAEDSKKMAAFEASNIQLKQQLSERNKTIEELSRLNNWQGGLDVKAKSDWKSFGKVLIEETTKPTIPALGEEFYTQWLLNSSGT